MSRNGVGPHLYKQLTPEERYRLMLAAVARGDEAEQERIMQNAPGIPFQVADTVGHALGTERAITWLRIERLELAVHLLHAIGLSADWEVPLREKNGRAQADRMYDIARTFAFLLTVHTEAARRFYEECGIDGAKLPLGPPHSMLVQVEEQAGHLAPTADEVAAMLRERRATESQGLLTAETVLATARALREKCIEDWS